MILNSKQICPNCLSPNIFFSRKRGMCCCEDCRQFFLEPKEQENSRQIFFSYGHDKNEMIVNMIKVYLEKNNYKVWIDKSKIHEGDEWRNTITKGLLNSNDVISFMSQHSVRNPGVCLDELKIALCVKGAYVNTVLLEDERNVNPPPSLCTKQWLDMSDWEVIYHEKSAQWDSWFENKMNVLMEVLNSPQTMFFSGEISTLKDRLHPLIVEGKDQRLIRHTYFGRSWLKKEVQHWLEEENQKILLLMGIPGAGKSAFATNMLHYDSAVLAGYFFEWDKPELCDARLFTRTLAYKIAVKYSDYRTALLNYLRGMDEKELNEYSADILFDNLIVRVLNSCIDGNRATNIIILDGLDESIENSGDILRLLENNIPKMPKWIRFLLTTRYDVRIENYFLDAHKVHLQSYEKNQIDDIKEYLKESLKDFQNHVVGSYDYWIDCVVRACEGSFLYAEQFCIELKEKKNIEYKDLTRMPKGIYGFYFMNLYRRFPTVETYRKVRSLLEVVSCKGSIPRNVLQNVLGMDSYELREALYELGSLVTQSEMYYFRTTDTMTVSFPHKTFADWLIDEEKSGIYWVDSAEGHRKMAVYTMKTLQEYQGVLKKDQKRYLEHNNLIDEDIRKLSLDLCTYVKNARMWNEYISFLLTRNRFGLDWVRKLSEVPPEYDIEPLIKKLCTFLEDPMKRRREQEYFPLLLYGDLFSEISPYIDRDYVRDALENVLCNDPIAGFFRSGASEDICECRDRGDYNADKLFAVLGIIRIMNVCRKKKITLSQQTMLAMDRIKLASLYYHGRSRITEIDDVLDEYGFLEHDLCRLDGMKFKDSNEEEQMLGHRNIYNTYFLKQYLRNEPFSSSEGVRELYDPDPEYVRLLVEYGADINKATEGAINDLATRVRFKTNPAEAEKTVLERKKLLNLL